VKAKMANYKTMQIWVKSGHRLHSYFEEMCQNAKNMHNTTNFYIRQVYTGLTQEKRLQLLQKEVLYDIQKYLPKMNDNQLLAYQKKLAKEKTKPIENRKEIKCNLFDEPSKESPYVSNQDCVIKDDKFLKFPKTKERLNIGKLGFTEGKLKQVRVSPKYGQYVVELIFAVSSEQEMKDSKNRFMSVDLGIDNLATIVTNTGRRPILVKGKNNKTINQRYNQLKAHYTGILRHGKNTNVGPFTSIRLEKINIKRFNRIKDLFHKASHQIEKIALERALIRSLLVKTKVGNKTRIWAKRTTNHSRPFLIAF
jgi:transposase